MPPLAGVIFKIKEATMVAKKQSQATEAVKEEKVEVAEEAIIVVPAETIDGIIRKRIYAALALGLAPIPVVDLVGLTAIQLDLVRAIAKEYDVPFKKNAAKSVITALIGSVVPVGAAPLFASLVKVVPYIGLTTGAVSMSILGGASTYAVGKVFAKHFASGGTLLDMDTDKLKDGFKEQYEKGKSYVSSLKKKKEETAAPASKKETKETETAAA